MPSYLYTGKKKKQCLNEITYSDDNNLSTIPSIFDHEKPPSEMEFVWISSRSSKATFFKAFGFSANFLS